MIACPNCGGNVLFDITTQQLSCGFCNSYFQPDAFDHKTEDGIEVTEFETTVFTCPQCGGEIYSTDNQSAGFCSFCGASTILYSRLTNIHKPNYIIPFKQTKEDCKRSYEKMMRSAIFAPSDLKNPKNIDSFRGIYMPYWAYYYTQNGDFTMDGTKSHRRGDYIYTDHYDLTGSVDAYYKGLYYDASSSFDDSLSEKVAPFDVKGMKKFSPGYLSGFYADTADVTSDTYEPVIKELVENQTKAQILSGKEFGKYSINEASENNVVIPPKLEATDSALFPVWFMSYRNRDRVAYATVNGQTGKVVVDIPVDMKKYLIGSAILALPIFLLLSLFLSIVPTTLTIISGALCILSALLYGVELYQIAQKKAGPGKKNIISFLATVIAILVASVVCIFDPVYDFYFYGATLLCLIAVILNIRNVINYYNILSTRRLPQFDKKGGDDRA